MLGPCPVTILDYRVNIFLLNNMLLETKIYPLTLSTFFALPSGKAIK